MAELRATGLGADGLGAAGLGAAGGDLLVNAPLLAAWSGFRKGNRPFTIPGHQGLAGRLSPELGALLESDVPLYGGLDTVKLTGEMLRAAEQAAAALWGGDWARFSTGGSTHGNQALALAVGQPGDTVLVGRNAHRSVLLGLVMAGLNPVWLPVDTDPRFGIPAGVRVSTLARAVVDHPSARGVFLTEPAYLGVTSDLVGLVGVAHAAGMPVLVDQAWGAHFGFHDDFPRHALQLGADAMVFSAHKTLPAYSQACLVVARTGRLELGRLDLGVEATATTSPAGSILASIDASRALLAGRGAELLGSLASVAAQARRELRQLPGVMVPGPEDFPVGRFDPAKLVIGVAGAGADGIAVESDLLAAGFPVEMADRDTVVPILTLVDRWSDVEPLVVALLASIRARSVGPARVPRVATWPIPAQGMSPRDAFFAAHRTVGWQDAAGQICAEVVAPYPPGVPVLVPGEIIDRQTVVALRELVAEGTRVAYAADPTLDTLQVVGQTPTMSSE